VQQRSLLTEDPARYGGQGDSWGSTQTGNGFFDEPQQPWPAAPPAVSQTTPPGRLRAGNHTLVTLAFWFTLIASVEVWWLNTPHGAVTGSATALIAAGRITGMVSGFVLLIEIVTMSRIGWLEYWFGAHDLLIWHRSLGTMLVVLVPAHAVLLVLGYAGASKAPVIHETWSMLTTMQDMISATVATGVLIGVGVFAIRALRRHMPYELWHMLHMTAYLVLLLGYGHEFALGAELIRPGFARWYWIALHVFVVACVVWGRLVEPVWFNLRHRFRVIEVVPEARGWVSIYVGGRNLSRLDT
jgi:predicted ferric reductase